MMTHLFIQIGRVVTPWYVTGITDGEGSFNISYTGEQVRGMQYKVTAHANNRGILLSLQRYFNCGRINIDNRGDNTLKFVVSNHNDLVTKVIPHFQQFPLQGSKALNFKNWATAVNIMVSGAHRTDTGRLEILALMNKMNSNRPFEDKYNYLSVVTPQVNNDWVVGFIDGEGHFAVEIIQTNNRPNPSVKFSLQIAQASHDILLLNAIKQYFGSGLLKPSYNIDYLPAVQNARGVSRYWFQQPVSQTRAGVAWNESPLLQLLDANPLLTLKQLDYLDWKLLLQMAHDGVHLTPEGLMQIRQIKNGMNQKRSKLLITDLASV